MAVRTVIRPKLWFNHHDLRPVSFSHDLENSRDLVDVTAFEDTFRRRAVGLRSHQMGGAAWIHDTADKRALTTAIEDELSAATPGIWSIAPEQDAKPRETDATALRSIGTTTAAMLTAASTVVPLTAAPAVDVVAGSLLLIGYEIVRATGPANNSHEIPVSRGRRAVAHTGGSTVYLIGNPSTAYMLNPRVGEISPLSGAAGEAQRLDFSAEGDGPLYRGVLWIDRKFDVRDRSTPADSDVLDNEDRRDPTAYIPVPGTGDIIVHLHVLAPDTIPANTEIQIQHASDATGSGRVDAYSGEPTAPMSRRVVISDEAKRWIRARVSFPAGSVEGTSVTIAAAYGAAA